ncbi:structural cement protein Gp24 [Listeria ilorinensis]|uniref:structural cement protein Gp24 n=1 Tax=Listeria ilorinensis TaxID=2867439 RepID=UPI001EF5BFD7|nr:hypothetical protein [Listeria ilorinensis]
MTIPVGQEYMQPEIGIGKLANYQGTQADSAVAAETILFGAPVEFSDGTAKKLTASGYVYGVAIAKEFVPELTGDKAGSYLAKEMVPVLRKGTISVQVGEDVKSGEKAVVDISKGTFVPASSTASSKSEIVGVFKTTAQADGLAHLEINLP